MPVVNVVLILEKLQVAKSPGWKYFGLEMVPKTRRAALDSTRCGKMSQVSVHAFVDTHEHGRLRDLQNLWFDANQPMYWISNGIRSRIAPYASKGDVLGQRI